MAMAADLGRGQQQPMDLRRALQDGRAVLAGGPGLGSQMILLRNEALPPPMPLAPQQPQQQPHSQQHYQSQQQQYYHLQYQQQHSQLSSQQQANGGNVVTQDFSYPVQGYVGPQDDPTRHTNPEIGAPGTTQQDQVSAANPNMASAMQSHVPSTVSSGSGFHHMEYLQPGGPLPESYVQPYPHTQSYPATASNYDAPLHAGTAQQGFLQPSYGVTPSAETSVNPPGTVTHEPGTNGFPAGAAVARGHFRGSSTEDDRRLAMIHEFGNDTHSHFQNQTPHFQPEYLHSIPLDQAESLPSVEYLANQISLQKQRLREMELQHLWRSQLEAELQRRRYEQLKQQEQSLRRQSAIRAPKNLRIRKGRGSSKYFQKSGIKNKSKLPAMTGPEGPGWCDICQTDCNTDEMLQYHIVGKKHQKKLQQLGKEGGNTLESARAAESLRQGPIDGKETSDLLNTDSNSCDQNLANFKNSGTGIEGKRDFTCINASSVEPLAKRIHLLSKGSEDQLLLQKSLLTERCDICNIACNTKMVLELHFKGKKHAANLKKLAEGAQSRKTGGYPKVARNDIKEETSGKESISGLFGSSVVEEQSRVLNDTLVLPDNSAPRESKGNNYSGNPDPCKAIDEAVIEKPKVSLSLEDHVRVFAIEAEKFQV